MTPPESSSWTPKGSNIILAKNQLLLRPRRGRIGQVRSDSLESTSWTPKGSNIILAKKPTSSSTSKRSYRSGKIRLLRSHRCGPRRGLISQVRSDSLESTSWTPKGSNIILAKKPTSSSTSKRSYLSIEAKYKAEIHNGHLFSNVRPHHFFTQKKSTIDSSIMGK